MPLAPAVGIAPEVVAPKVVVPERWERGERREGAPARLEARAPARLEARAGRGTPAIVADALLRPAAVAGVATLRALSSAPRARAGHAIHSNTGAVPRGLALLAASAAVHVRRGVKSTRNSVARFRDVDLLKVILAQSTSAGPEAALGPAGSPRSGSPWG